MRLKSYAPAMISLALTGLLCALLTPPVATFAGRMPDYFSRTVGFGLLAVALFALALVFRSVPANPAPLRVRHRLRRDSEFRRGFASTRTPSNGVGAKRPRLEPRFETKGQVIALRRPAAAPAPEMTPLSEELSTPRDNIAVMRRHLQSRANALWRRRVG